MDLKNLLALSMIKGVGPAFIKSNLSRIASDSDCLSLVRDYKSDQINVVSSVLLQAEAIIQDCAQEGIEIISILSPDYPLSLKEISDPPCVLYIKGNKSLLYKCIAIIGTRHSSPLGNKIAERLGGYYSNEFAICNGLVEGIDEHSIRVNGIILSNVVGIISGGLCYKETCSKNHQRIIEDVLNAGGVIVSEYPPRIKSDEYSGSKASRIQAGMSKGLILVQSSIEGGSKYTLKTYAKLGRPLGVIHFPSSEEYSTDLFSGNRLIYQERTKGIAEIIGLKTSTTIKIGDIIMISSRDDYELFTHSVNLGHTQILDLGI